MFTTILVN
ncbi:hypothetical protein E2C01_035023 [Portunus trituberculatus]|uniref:Uncharacterized protein n=1 Tax=Portunus trituberculatus TaxID=210409 RepID=A0A5B7F4G2_PORTR|nr:hypothetical protein [Portunus trituberculatus]